MVIILERNIKFNDPNHTIQRFNKLHLPCVPETFQADEGSNIKDGNKGPQRTVIQVFRLSSEARARTQIMQTKNT